ncbi:MAG: L-threonylcarbamoyladenylate synthase [Marinoscillum sp.]
MAEIGQDIDKAAALLKTGQLVAIPTETVYGLAGNALDESAILEIFKVKKRPKFDPLIAHTDSLDKVRSYVTHIPEPALKLADAFWPGPLTILLNKKSHIPDLLTSGLSAVAVRMPRHKIVEELLGKLDFPLAAPSANPFGYVSPTTAGHVNDQLGAQIPYILNGGPCDVGIESTIIGFDDQERPIIYRLGGKKEDDIERIVGRVQLNINHSADPMAPGMLKTHYAPGKRVIIGKLDMLIKRFHNRNFGVISFHQKFADIAPEKQICLSETKDLNQAARNLFSALRKMDQTEVEFIITERFPDEGLGQAINDRLSRAAAR